MQAQRRSEGAPNLEQSSPRLRGMRNFVKSMLSVHAKGMDSRRLLLQQTMAFQAKDPSGQPPSPTIGIMQQNSRIVVLTLEVGHCSSLLESSIDVLV